MNYTQSKVSYYADFVLVPVLAATASAHMGSVQYLSLPVGIALWSLMEYLIHRELFHRVMKREHWMHHIRPAGYVAAPWWITGTLHLTAFVSAFLTGWLGLFVGVEVGYFAYIMTHDAIHHEGDFYRGTATWFGWRIALHDVHHRGVEANFGVVSSVWDKLFGTHCPPEQAKMWAAAQRNQRP